MKTDRWTPSVDDACVLRALHLLEAQRLAAQISSPNKKRKRPRKSKSAQYFPITWPDVSVLDAKPTRPLADTTLKKRYEIFTIGQPYPVIIIRSLVLALAKEPVDAESALENLERNKCIRRCVSMPWLPQMVACLTIPDNKCLRVGFSRFEKDHEYLESMATLDGRELIREGTSFTDIRDSMEDHKQPWFTLPAIELTGLGHMWMDSVVNQTAMHSAERISDDDTLNEGSAVYCFRRHGDMWEIRYEGSGGFFRDLNGFHYIHQLMTQWRLKRPAPGRLSAIDMVRSRGPQSPSTTTSLNKMGGDSKGGIGHASAANGADNVLDLQAEAELKEMVLELEAEIKDLRLKQEGNTESDSEQSRIQECIADYLRQMTAIGEQLNSARGLSNRPRKLGGTDSERARQSIRHALRLAYDNLKSGTPSLKNLATHLEKSIPPASEGQFVYRPETDIDWQL